LFTTLCILALSSGATAQQQKQQQTQKPESQQQQYTKEAGPIAGVVPLGVTVAETALVTEGYRASKLLHAPVFNDAGQKIGKIGDLVISPKGELMVAVVDVGGFVGLAKHHIAIPVRQFTQIHPKLVLPNATKESLKGLPEFIPVG
jgi:sporulation protein YlmC with PRC-barrel domain